MHGHPAGATSLGHPGMRELMDQELVFRVVGNMCAFGMEQMDEDGIGEVRTPSGFMTNVWGIVRI